MRVAMPMDADHVRLLGQAFRATRRKAASRPQADVVGRGGVQVRSGAADWDGFAEDTQASFQATRDHLKAQALKGFRKLLFFEFFEPGTDGNVKIGQCAVLKRGRNFEIQDGILLSAQHQNRWCEAMQSLLHELGPGDYVYGGLWSCEASRDADLLAVRGVTIKTVRPFAVQAVDFDKWPSWETYWKSVSENVRRNARNAQERVPGLRLEQYCGWSMLRTIPAIVKLQQHSLTRKGLGLNGFRQAARFVYQMIFGKQMFEVALALGDEGVLASFYGARIGGKYYYVYGGQCAGGSGANWFLMREMAQLAYDRDPSGKFIMGNVDYAIHDEEVGGGLLRARRSLRVTDYQTSLITFRYNA